MGEFRKPRRFNQRDGARSEGAGFDRSKFFGRKKPEGQGGFERRESRFQSKGKGLELFNVTCDKCGKQTEVPFKPTGNKPVYCRECFKGESPRESRKSDHFESKGRSNESFEAPNAPNASSDEFARINKKLDKIIKALKID